MIKLTSHLWQRDELLSPHTWCPSSPAAGGYLHEEAGATQNQSVGACEVISKMCKYEIWITHSLLLPRWGPLGSHSEPWHVLWSPPAWRREFPTEQRVLQINTSRNINYTCHTFISGRVLAWREKHRSSSVHWPELNILCAISYRKSRSEQIY